MSRLSVTTQPQAIALDNNVRTALITNNGPGTLYVDDHSAINELSFALRATDTMVWDGSRPLWMKSKSTSDVTMGYNTELRVSKSAEYVELYRNPAWNTNPGILTPLIECVSFNSLHIFILDAITAAPSNTLNFQWEVTVSWYDASDVLITSDVYQGWRFDPAFAGQGCLLNIPVRGFACTVSVLGRGHVAITSASLRVLGTSRLLTDSFESGYPPRSGARITGEPRTTGAAFRTLWDASTPIKLNAIGHKLRVSIAPGAVLPAATVTYLIAYDAAAAGGWIIGALNIPTSGLAQADFIVPKSIPCYLGGGGLTNPVLQVSFVWSDYNGP